VSGSRQAPRPLILVHTAHPQAVEHAGDGFGRLLSPRQFARAADTAETGIPWAADNDCFQGLDPVAYTRMLTAIHGLPGGLFVTVPDVVGDAQATLDLFDVWAERVRGTGLPVALVAQNGLTIFNAPWDRFDALFIGGTTEWKLSVDAHYLATYAKRTGKFLHMGRVLDLVEQTSPWPYLELFARRQRLGWDTWGDEALEHVEMAGSGIS
jgi:hypothetical protein